MSKFLTAAECLKMSEENIEKNVEVSLEVIYKDIHGAVQLGDKNVIVLVEVNIIDRIEKFFIKQGFKCARGDSSTCLDDEIVYQNLNISWEK